MYDCFCFDFDGTLVDSAESAYHAYREVAPQFGCPLLSREEMQYLRNLHAREIMRELGISLLQAPRFAARMRQLMRQGVMETPPVSGMPETLQELVRRGCRLGVLSSNAPSTIAAYLQRYYSLEFDYLVGGVGLFGKAGALRKLVSRQRLERRRLAYVGDELRDHDAARKAGIAFIAVGWGYTAFERLAADQPAHCLQQPDGLLACAG